MKELAKSLDNAIKDLGNECLEIAMKKWAGYCLDTFSGKLLRDGLEISCAISQD